MQPRPPRRRAPRITPTSATTAGVADYIEVTTTQTAALQAQRAAIDARVCTLNAAVGLVRATGGGWSREQLALASTP